MAHAISSNCRRSGFVFPADNGQTGILRALPLRVGAAVRIQIDGMHLDDKLLMISAVGIDINAGKLSLGVMESATKNAKVVRALLEIGDQASQFAIYAKLK